jgi:hypothetical protein
LILDLADKQAAIGNLKSYSPEFCAEKSGAEFW